MPSLVWGKAQQLIFFDEHEYYQVLGSLCRNDAYVISFETNSDTESWSDAFRIKCLMDDSRTPDAFLYSMRTARRVNCNDYVQHLHEYHRFEFEQGTKTLVGNHDIVKQTVPLAFYDDFENGYALVFTRHERPKKPVKNSSSPQTPIHTAPTVSPTRVDSVPIKPYVPPKPKLIPVSIGDNLIHKSFGEGVVYAVDGNYVRIRFDSVGEKSFVNPDAFVGGFLKAKGEE